MTDVTEDTDGFPATAYLHHSLIPLLLEGLSAGVGDSVTVEVDQYGDWRVTDVCGRTAAVVPLDLDFRNSAQLAHVRSPPAPLRRICGARLASANFGPGCASKGLRTPLC
ncbi:hypothetical protein [Pimelobacter simplex]|uniref:hypothetical protein n=1 Tax=Nocardioides simplex TaxID=2045 RepID=UPI00214F61FB|nr:hypothetical protein [Pimelobacter simplex]UUW92552.1 hypothetical protein M0M43_14020 [Pimelobacter simplex]UUW96379.1 hypothetical protein M0M48_02650 [Pimelobacter simplex]